MSPVRMMISFDETNNHPNHAAIMDLVSENCVFECNSPASDGTLYQGKEAIAQFWRDKFTQWSDALSR
jgi:ketosteroid isomerase-like protein